MDRRTVFGLAAAAASLAALSGARADAPAEHHHHHEAAPGIRALFQSANACVAAAQLCQAHCQVLFASGDRSLADCSRSVDALVPVCQALAALAAQESPFLPEYAKVAAGICRACEQQCRKHEKEHSQCRDCADACAACAKQCDAVAA
jgi:Cys-rich four helix bundle protein (predicted Tat secretion target)